MSTYNTYSNLVKPSTVEWSTLDDGTSVVTIYPLQKGFGVTLGSIIRRVLLSSIKGSVICGVRIDNVSNEFTTVPHVYEDVNIICLNLRKVILESGDEDVIGTIAVEGPCVVTAGMIQFSNTDTVVINPDHVICNVANAGKLSMKVFVKSGIGVLLSDTSSVDHKLYDIAFDCYFSPVKMVNFTVDTTRFDKFTDYDKLTLEIITNGSIDSKHALNIATAIIREYMNVFTSLDDSTFTSSDEKKLEVKCDYNLNLLRKTADLELSVRSANCLNGADMRYIGDLVQKTEIDMLKMPNFGRKSLDELRSLLSEMNLSFGCDIGVWPPENMDELLLLAEKEFASD